MRPCARLIPLRQARGVEIGQISPLVLTDTRPVDAIPHTGAIHVEAPQPHPEDSRREVA